MVIVALVSVALSVGWHDGAWKWQLPLGISVSFVLTVVTGLAVEVFNLAPDDFPISFYFWVWLIWFSVIIIVMGWTKAHWLLRSNTQTPEMRGQLIALEFQFLIAQLSASIYKRDRVGRALRLSCH